MIKPKDEVSSGVFPNVKISKPSTASDHARQKQAESVRWLPQLWVWLGCLDFVRKGYYWIPHTAA
jgi:hypothetical protein